MIQKEIREKIEKKLELDAEITEWMKENIDVEGFFIEDKNGNYIDYIKFHELYDSNIVRYYNQKDLCELLHKKLMEVER